MTHHNREWRKEIDKYFGLKLTEDYYPEAWQTVIGRWIALKISLLDLLRNIKREFLLSLCNSGLHGRNVMIERVYETYDGERRQCYCLRCHARWNEKKFK